MEVAPRLNVAKRIVAQTVMELEKEPKEQKEEMEKNPADDPTTGFFGGSTILIVIFASIIVMLILVVVWLVTRTDRLTPWAWGCTPAPALPQHAYPAPQPAYPAPQSAYPAHPQPAKNSAHADIVALAGADELAMYASVPAVKSQEDTPKEIAADVDAEIEANLEAHMDALAVPPEAAESAIDEVIDAEAEKMDAEQHREIEQVSKKTHSIVHTYPTAESVSLANFDISIVLQCCRGEKPTHKGYIWRYKGDDITAPPE